MPHVELFLANLFQIEADVIVIPRSTAGTFSSSFDDRLRFWGILESGSTSSTLGSVTYFPAKELFPKKNHADAFPYKGIAYATTVQDQGSNYATIRDIGRKLGLLTKEFHISSIATPLLGSGTGGLKKGHMYPILWAAFQETAVDDVKLTVASIDKKDHDLLSRVKFPSHSSAKLALQATVLDLRSQFWSEELASAKDFYFQKAAEKLAEFKAFSPRTIDRYPFYVELEFQFKSKTKNFQELLNSYQENSQQYAFILLVGQLIAHIDYHAYNKNLWNEYSDKRTLGKSGIRQTLWLQYLLEYKKDGSNTILLPSISNAFRFLENPENELTMMSQRHRELVLSRIFNSQSSSNLQPIFNFFQPLLQCVNPKNAGHLYTAILYSEPVTSLWLSEEQLKADEAPDLGSEELDIPSVDREISRQPDYSVDEPTKSAQEHAKDIQARDQYENLLQVKNRPAVKPSKSTFGLLSEITDQDLLDYKVYAHAIVKFIKDPSTKAPLTIGIFAPWGRGKTTLMKYIKEEMKSYPNAKPEETEDLRANANSIASYGTVLRWLHNMNGDSGYTANLVNPIVWFNAWKFQKSEQVWSGFAYEIIRQLVSNLNPVQQEHFWLFLNLKRIDRREITDKITFTLLNKVIRYGWYLILLTVAASFTGAYEILSWVIKLPPIWTSVAAAICGAAGGITYIHRALTRLKKTKVDLDLAKYVHAPNYREQMGFFHSVEEDLKKALELLVSRENPAVIIIDDLDRCSPKIVADIIEAINLFITGDFPDCYFILGQDAQMVTASLDAAYKDIAGKTAYVQKNYGSLGWYFMEKFIQLPFTIPSISKQQSEHLLQRWLGAVDEAIDTAGVETKNPDDKTRIELLTKLAQTSNNQESLLRLLPEVNMLALRLAFSRPDQVIELKNKILDLATDSLVQDEQEIVNLIELYGKYLGNSPRTIKRFSNLYRFQRLLQFAGRNSALTFIDTQAIARWVVVMVRWPQLVRCIQWDTSESFFTGATPEERVREFESSILDKPHFKEWKDSLPTGTDAIPWLSDNHLYEFMTSTKSENGSLSKAVMVGFW